MAKEKKFNIPAIWTCAIDMLAMQKILKKQLKKTVASQVKYYNFKHLQYLYNISSLVYLNSKNIDSTRPTKELDWK